MKKNLPKNTPMSSAPFVYDPDGSIAWDKMWTTFCALAASGGPPHRGEVLKPKLKIDTAKPEYQQAVSEILRAYKMLIPYLSISSSPGWIRIKLYTPNMAKWYSNIINSENVYCKSDGSCLLLPVNDDFTIKEIKNLVTVVAKAYHYWSQHRTVTGRLAILLFGYDFEARLYSTP